MKCPVCLASDHEVFWEKAQVPVLQNAPLPDEISARSVVRGRLKFVLCRACGFAFNAGYVSSLIKYDEQYDNQQGFSGVFAKHLQGRIERLLDLGVRDRRIVEIGCGQGEFLNELVQKAGGHTEGVGYDPSYGGAEVLQGGKVSFVKSYYDRECVSGASDIVLCRHVIEHIAGPVEFLGMIAATLKGVDSRVYLETPCLEWILRRGVVWDLFYEHCSLFTVGSLRVALERSNLSMLAASHVFEKQYLWGEAGIGSEAAFSGCYQLEMGSLLNAAAGFKLQQEKNLARWSHKLQLWHKSSGRVAVWGAGAKGVTFVNMVDGDKELIDVVIDINPNKQGKFVPGTGHEIIGPQEIMNRGIRCVVVLNPNYVEEIRQLLVLQGLQGKIVLENLMSVD